MRLPDDDDPFAALRPVDVPSQPVEDGNVFPFPPDEAYRNEFIDTEDDKPRKSEFFCAANLKGIPVPERQWLVKDWIPQNTVTLFGGDGGTGKSLLALQLAVACATRTQWLEKDIQSGRVIFISAEDDQDELHRRIHDIITAERMEYDDLESLTIRSLAGEDALLAVDSQTNLIRSALYHELSKRADDDTPTLIVIDTLADVYPANENDRAKVRQFVGILRSLALNHDCAVVLLGHPSLTGLASGSGTSGSTAWNNSVRARMYLSRIQDEGFEPDPDVRTLSNMKSNYGPVGGQVEVKWTHGRFVKVPDETDLDRMSKTAKAERVFINILTNFESQGRRVSANPGPTFAPAVFARLDEAEGCTKQILNRAMEALLNRGDVVIAHHKVRGHQRSHIAFPSKNQGGSENG